MIDFRLFVGILAAHSRRVGTNCDTPRRRVLVRAIRGNLACHGRSRHEIPDPSKEGGHIESLERHVMPRSLYLTQLRERLGDAAVRNIAAPNQI
jgi:hypothetical protein